MLYKRAFRKEKEVVTFLIKVLKRNLAINLKFTSVNASFSPQKRQGISCCPLKDTKQPSWLRHRRSKPEDKTIPRELESIKYATTH